MEQLLHYCWKHRLFSLWQLTIIDSQALEVIDVGLHNVNSGPDFLNAKIKIDNTVWVGNVEIHAKSNDWYVHRHERDAAYNNVILHVAGEIDGEVKAESGHVVPQLQLFMPASVAQYYEQLQTIDTCPPCYETIPNLSILTIHTWMSALQIERLEQKTHDIERRLQQCDGDWEAALFITPARNYGFGINSEALEQWARSIPLHAVDHHRDDLFQIEVFFMGQVGLLERHLIPQKYHEAMDEEGYFERLRTKYLYLQRKFSLRPIEGKIWRFLRLRPQNFPYTRAMQLANLYHSRRFGLCNLVESETLDDLRVAMKSAVSPYWETHYVLGSVSKRSEERLLEVSLNVLPINTAIPFLFAYGRHEPSESPCRQAINYLEQLKPERNHTINMWQQCDFDVQNAGDTRALIQLETQYCDQKEYLRCRIGYEYLEGRKY